MEITDTPQVDVRQVKVTAVGGRASVQVDGLDCTNFVSGYTIHHRSGEPAELVVQLVPGKVAPGFEGDARVFVGVPYEPGPAAAHFLSAIDAGLLEKAALARPDLGGPHGFTAAVLAQLQQWANGEFDQAKETDGLLS
ncbi:MULTISPECIES: hypothetical protein [unclassified Streptomyces]|uniref:hypothetical protein n=1 Tax=unclassified Streptomyces TaxID=2593676 RepID=UPI001E3BA963|nr:hypothetical protein [Streptomyces sp. CB02980]MCB8906781.1 hypothetical protein [Streptomyces sp. CB02980]